MLPPSIGVRYWIFQTPDTDVVEFQYPATAATLRAWHVWATDAALPTSSYFSAGLGLRFPCLECRKHWQGRWPDWDPTEHGNGGEVWVSFRGAGDYG